MRLIDADALCTEVIECKRGYIASHNDVVQHDLMCDNVVSWVDGAPTIEAAPVVRCKDCKNYVYYTMMHGFSFNACCADNGYIIHRNPDFFCANGARKVNETY